MKGRFKTWARRVITVVVFLIGLALVLRFLPEKQKWLLIGRHSAERYGSALLAGDIKGEEKFKDDFIDYVVVTDPRTKTVMFSSHESHDTAFIYAPSLTENEINYQSRKATRIAAGWYSFK
jgi:hypothetical protein